MRLVMMHGGTYSLDECYCCGCDVIGYLELVVDDLLL